MHFATWMPEELQAASVAIGPEAVGELMEAEVGDLAGPKGGHQEQRWTTDR